MDAFKFQHSWSFFMEIISTLRLMQLMPRLYLALTNPGEDCRAMLYALTASSDRLPLAETILTSFEEHLYNVRRFYY